MMTPSTVTVFQTSPYGCDLTRNLDLVRTHVRHLHEEIALFPANSLCGTDTGRIRFPLLFRRHVRDGLDALADEVPPSSAVLLYAPEGVYREDACMVHLEQGKVDIRPGIVKDSCLFSSVPSLELLVLVLAQSVPKAVPDAVLAECRTWAERQNARALCVAGALPWTRDLACRTEEALTALAESVRLPLCLAQPVCEEDGVLYGGRSLVCDGTGQMRRGRLFRPDTLSCPLQTASARKSPVTEMSRTGSVRSDGDGGSSGERSCPELWQALVFGTRTFVQKTGAQDVVIGVSGGIDSALVLAIAVDALGCDHVHAVLMPSQFNPAGSVLDAEALCSNLHVTPHVLPIGQLYDLYRDVLEPLFAEFPGREQDGIRDVTYENVQARIRGSLLCALANRLRALVLNTSNKSETATGFSTLYGDTVGALAVIGDLSKTDVYALSRWYTAERAPYGIPGSILEKAPSAELRPDQKDSDTLPPYSVLDPCLDRFLEGQPPETAEDREIFWRIASAEFKRRQEPVALVVSERPFGRVVRLPMAHGYLP